MDDSFTGALHATWPIHGRMIGQAFGAGLDGLLEAIGSRPIALGDIADDLFQVVDRTISPD